MSFQQVYSFDEMGDIVYAVDWPAVHCDGPLDDASLAIDLDDGSAAYELEEPALRIDIHLPARISRCRSGLFLGNLPRGEAVLLADNVVDRPPLFLRFSQPLSAVGARVTATATQELDYWAQCQLLLSDGQRASLQPRKARLRSTGVSAPFMGCTVTPGLGILGIWFDALDLSGDTPVADAQSQLLQIGIGELCLIVA